MADHKSHWLPVGDPRNCAVLGARASRDGTGIWEELDWSHWWLDGDADYVYFHVPCRKGGRQDGCVFRVGCWWQPGSKYRGREIWSIGLGFLEGRLHWIIRTKGKEPPGKEPPHADTEG